MPSRHLYKYVLDGAAWVGLRNRGGSRGDPYAVRDFLAVDPALGTSADLRALVDAAHSLGLRIILDWTLNRSSRDNPLTVQHPDWFQRDAKGQVTYYVPGRDAFAGFDFAQPALRRYLIDAMLAWVTRYHLDGLRFDDHGHNLAALIDHLGLRRLTLVVHDVGGPIAALLHGPVWRLFITRFNAELRALIPLVYGDRAKLTPAIYRQYLAPLVQPADRHGLFAFAEQVFSKAGWCERWGRGARP